MSQLIQDLRFSTRSLVKQPGFTLAAILTLALAIGPNSAIFSVVDSVLLQPLPFPGADRVMMVWAMNPELAEKIGSDDLPPSTANLVDFQEGSSPFESLALAEQGRQSLTGQGEPEQLATVLVTSDFFKVLQAPALVGRTLNAEDETPGTPLSIVLSYNYWQRRFHGDRSVIGRTFVLDGKPLNVVGVMPPRFAVPRGSEMPSYLSFAPDPDAWVPRAHTLEERTKRGDRGGFMIGRLKPGMSREAAEKHLNALSLRLAEMDPRHDRGWSIRLLPIAEQMRQGLRPILLLLWAAGMLVLLIACVNVANLLLARAASRQKEIALRTAIGADRRRIVSQLLVESSVLSLAGGALGVFLGWALLRISSAAIPAALAGAVSFDLDARTLAFTLLVCALSSLLVGLFPAFQMMKPDLAGMLREGTRAGAGTAGSRRTRSALVVAEVAVAVVVLVGAGLLLRSFLLLMAVDPGFQTEKVLTFKLDLPVDRSGEELADFYGRLHRELNSLPGVVDAGIVSNLPLGGDDAFAGIEVEGKPKPESGEPLLVGGRTATPGYFEALGIELKKGRLLQTTDTRDRPFVAVIDEAMAEAYWPGEEAVGRRLKRADVKESPWITVVGVVANLRHQNLYSEPRPTMWMAAEQKIKLYMPNQVWVVARTEGDPRTLASSVRKAVYAVDRNQPVSLIRPYNEVVKQSIARNRLSLLLLSVLGLLALILAVVGIYGITSYSVAQRTREIGLRIALGAQRAEVLRLVIVETGLLAGAGIALGIGLALALSRIANASAAALLYQVRSTDPLTFFGVSAVLALIALSAAYIPGRRAMRVSPMVALRAD